MLHKIARNRQRIIIPFAMLQIAEVQIRELVRRGTEASRGASSFSALPAVRQPGCRLLSALNFTIYIIEVTNENAITNQSSVSPCGSLKKMNMSAT